MNQNIENLIQNGGLPTNDIYLKAGEDLVNDVTKVEQRFAYSLVTLNGTTTIKSGSGFMHLYKVGKPSMPSILIYDNTAASGALIDIVDLNAAQGSFLTNVSFGTGLTFIVGAGVSPNLLVAYR